MLAAAGPVLLRGVHAEAQPRPPTIIDSQVHAYEANTPKRPWDKVPNWPPHAGVVAVHRKGRDEDRAVDADLVHRRHHLVAGDATRWKCKRPIPAGSRSSSRSTRKETNRAPGDPGLERICRAAVKHNFPINLHR
jgi:hypothetical protein